LRLVAAGAVAGNHRREVAELRFRVAGRQGRQDFGRARLERALAVGGEEAEDRGGEGLRARPDAVAPIGRIALPDETASTRDDELLHAIASGVLLE
jgi:hypothetical protein